MKYITEFSDVRKIDPPFNLREVLAEEKAKHYSYLMTHGKIALDDEAIILERIKTNLISYFPEEIEDAPQLFEGGKRTITVNAYERDPKAREACLRHHGRSCRVCSFDFERIYGEIGKDYIHVHHIVPLHLRKGQYQVNPISDLIPVCPNCHAMLHRSNPPMDPNELREIYLERKKN